MAAFRTTIATIATVSAGSPRKPAMTAAATRTRIMKSANCAAKILQGLLGLASRIEFGPYRERRKVTSSPESPPSSEVWSCCVTASTVIPCQGDAEAAAGAWPSGLGAFTAVHLFPKHAKQCQGYGQNHGTE